MLASPSSALAAAALIAALVCLEWVAARRLGLGRAGAALAAAGCAGSGVAVLVAWRGARPAAGALAGLGPPGLDLVAIGTVLVAGGAIAWARGRERAPGVAANEHAGDRAGQLSRAIAFALLVAAVALVLARRGLPERAFQVAVPGPEGLRVAWLAAPVAALALAGLASATGRLRARGAIAFASCVAALVAVGAPGFHALASIAGDGAGWIALTAAFAASGGLALLAGDALESAPRGARFAGGLAFAGLVALVVAQPLAQGAPRGGDPDDELVAFDTRPAGNVEGRTEVAGRVRADVGADELRLVLAPSVGDGLPARVSALELGPVRDGWRAFASGPIDLRPLPAATWRFDVEVLRRRDDGVLTTIGRRTAAIARVGGGATAWTLGLAIVTAFAALFVLPGTRWSWIAAVLAVVCSVAVVSG